MLSGRRAVVIFCGLLQGLVVFSLTFRFFVNSHLDHSRAWIPVCSLTAALAAPLLSLQSFYNYARGHREVARSFFRAMHSVYLISAEQQNCACPRSANCSGICWEEGMGGGKVLVFREVGTTKSLHSRCEMWFDCVERKRRAKLPLSTTAPRAFTAAPSF